MPKRYKMSIVEYALHHTIRGYL